MNKLLGLLIVALGTSNSALAQAQSTQILCETENLKIVVEMQNYGLTPTTGPAEIQINNQNLKGVWNLMAAPVGTRLTGSYFLNISSQEIPEGSFQINAIYSPQYSPALNINGGWLKISGQSGSIDCTLIK